jgi:quercetin dioxygenase-like cupin family protein
MRRTRPLLVVLALAALAARTAAAQEAASPTDSAAGPTCAAVDSAVVDSAVQVALVAARGPRPIQPRLIVVDPPVAPSYASLDEVRWQTVELPGGGRLTVGAVHTAPASRTRQLLLRLPAGATVPAHWHGTHETLVVLRGTLTVRDSSDQVVQLPTGGFSFQPAGARHSLAAGRAETLVLVTSDGTWDVHVDDAAPGSRPSSNGGLRDVGGR